MAIISRIFTGQDSWIGQRPSQIKDPSAFLKHQPTPAFDNPSFLDASTFNFKNPHEGGDQPIELRSFIEGAIDCLFLEKSYQIYHITITAIAKSSDEISLLNQHKESVGLHCLFARTSVFGRKWRQTFLESLQLQIVWNFQPP